jgi:serine/threonine protein kinase
VPLHSTAEVLDFDEGPRPYLVTEFIDGPTLTSYVRSNGPMRGSDLEQLAISVATALKAIHSAGIIHRDLKPANVLLSATGARVIDFGISWALDASSDVSRGTTKAGTYGYMDIWPRSSSMTGRRVRRRTSSHGGRWSPSPVPAVRRSAEAQSRQ